MEGIRFYLEFASPKHKRQKVDTGNVIAVFIETGRMQRGLYLFDCVAPVYTHKNSEVASAQVSRDVLGYRCKRISEKQARSVHKALFAHLEREALREESQGSTPLAQSVQRHQERLEACSRGDAGAIRALLAQEGESLQRHQERLEACSRGDAGAIRALLAQEGESLQGEAWLQALYRSANLTALLYLGEVFGVWREGKHGQELWWPRDSGEHHLASRRLGYVLPNWRRPSPVDGGITAQGAIPGQWELLARCARSKWADIYWREQEAFWAEMRRLSDLARKERKEALQDA